LERLVAVVSDHRRRSEGRERDRQTETDCIKKRDVKQSEGGGNSRKAGEGKNNDKERKLHTSRTSVDIVIGLSYCRMMIT
jgi:hypothetical protein